MAGAFAVDVVPAIAMPFESAVIVWTVKVKEEEAGRGRGTVDVPIGF